MKVIRFILLTLLVLSPTTSLTIAQTTFVVDVDQLTHELQKGTPGKDELNLVWWIPEDYWRAILEREKFPKAQVDEVVGLLRPYTVVAVFDGKMAPGGSTTFRSESQIRSSMRIIDANGTEYSVLANDKIGPAATSLLDMVRPIISNALGKLGTNFHFLVFPGLNADGQSIASPKKSGSLKIRLEPGREVAWELPLPSLVPMKKCPVDGALLNGTWKYCPWHGAELK